MRFSALRGERVLLGTGAVVINDCYNANPLSMRAALDDLASQETAGRRVAVLGDMLELGAGEAEHHREIGAYASGAGVELLVAVGPRAAAMVDSFGGEARAVADARAAAALARDLVAPGDLVLVKGSRGGSSRGDCGRGGHRRRARRGTRRGLMGEVLIGGTASLLICIFLSPKFIGFLRAREFGQQIREEGPQEHHAKAGTPTMGGLIIFTAIAVPFFLLTNPTRARSGSSVSRWRVPRSGSPTTTRSSSSAARWG